MDAAGPRRGFLSPLAGNPTVDRLPFRGGFRGPGRAAARFSSLRLRGTPRSISFCSRGDPPPSARREGDRATALRWWTGVIPSRFARLLHPRGGQGDVRRLISSGRQDHRKDHSFYEGFSLLRHRRSCALVPVVLDRPRSGPRRAGRAAGRAAARRAALHAEPRPVVHGSQRSTLRRLLRLLLRRLDQRRTRSRRTRRGWSVYGKLYDENQQFLWGLLEQAAKPDPARAPERQKIGDYFAACMDEAAIERRRRWRRSARSSTRSRRSRSTAELAGARSARLHRGPATAACSSASARTRTRATRTQVIAFAARRRPRAAGPRLLPEGRRPLGRAAREVPGPRRGGPSSCSAIRPTRGGRRGDGDAARDGAGEGLAHPGREARPLQDLPPHAARRARAR